MKTYSSKSNAIRAYLSSLGGLSELTREQVAECVVIVDGKFVVDEAAIEDELETDKAGDPLEDDEDMEAEYDVETDVPVQPLRPIKGTGSYKDVPLRRRTTDGGAVGWAWSVFDRMPETATRKEAIAEAVRVGIAFYTARTQYQKWQHRNDPKPEGSK